MDEFNVIIAGGRKFKDYELMRQKCDTILSSIKKKIVVFCGEAEGADSLGKKYAEERGYDVRSFPADWRTHKKSAGVLRNKQMGDEGHALIAFWDGVSTGTKHMIDYAKKKALSVRVIMYESKK